MVSLSRLAPIMASAAALGLAPGAQAQVIFQSGPVTVLAAGAQCDRSPDRIVDSPEAEGRQVEFRDSGTVFVLQGNVVPSAVGMGFAVWVRIAEVGPGEPVQVTITDPAGIESRWGVVAGAGGDIDFGRLPAHGEALPLGIYQLSVSQRGKRLFTYAIGVRGEDKDGLCTPPVA